MEKRCVLVAAEEHLQELGLVPTLGLLEGRMTASHQRWLGLPAFSRGASWLIVIQMSLFQVAIKAGEGDRECCDGFLSQQQVHPGHPHQCWGIEIGTQAAKIGFGGGFRMDLHVLLPLWVAWGGGGYVCVSLKNPMGVGSSALEGYPLLKHPFVPPDCAGLELREGIPVLLLF